MNVYLPNLRLPSEYQEVEYIQSSGTQWIDTLHQHTANSKVEIKFSYQSMSTRYNLLFGSRSRYNVNDAFSIFIENSSTISLTIGGKIISPASTSANTIYDISFSKDYFIINGATTTLNSSLTSYGYNDLLFNFMENGQSISGCNPISAKVYYCRIYEGNTLVRDFVPCYRKSDSVIGLYDLVNNQFYTNSGTGAFSKGNDVTMAELKNAYIGEVYEYSYNFVGKTIAQIQSDGWTTAQGTPTIGTYGYSSANSNRARSNFTLPSLATARKITFYTNVIFTSSTGSCDQIRIGNSGRTNLTGYYLDNVGNCFPQLLGNNITTITTASGAGTYKMTVELDLQNATYKYSITGYNDTTGSLTSSQISTIRGFTLAEAMSDGNTGYIKDFKLIVEY